MVQIQKQKQYWIWQQYHDELIAWPRYSQYRESGTGACHHYDYVMGPTSTVPGRVAGAYILNTFCHGCSRSLSEQFLPQWLSPISPRVSYLQQVVPLVVDALKFSDRVLAGLEFEALSSVAKNASNPDVSLISNLISLISLCTYLSF